MSRSEASGLLDQIRAHPEDDAPRLVYADWLDEHGAAARAEFIRVQIERAALPTWDVRQIALRLREDALLRDHGTAWRRELPAILGVAWGDFRRGFMATAAFETFARLGTTAAEVHEAAPVEAAIVPWPREDDAAGDIAPVMGLRELTINRGLVDADDMARLADSPVLSTLRALNIPDAGTGPDAFRPLCRSPHLKALTALRVPKNSIGNGGVRALVESKALPALAELDLSEHGSYGRYGEDPIVDLDGCVDLADWPGLARLHTLRLNGNDVRHSGLRALLRSKQATGLKHLALRANGLDGRSLEEFETARPGLQLDVLDLGENLFRGSGAEHLARAACLRELKVLTIDQCELGPSAVRKLARAPFRSTLRMLNADFNMFGTQGLAALLKVAPPAFHTLRLQNNDIENAGVALLAASAASDGLRELDLSYNPFDHTGAEALADAKHLKNLLVLRIDGGSMGLVGAQILKKSPLAKRLGALEGLHTVPPTPPPEGDDGGIPF